MVFTIILSLIAIAGAAAIYIPTCLLNNLWFLFPIFIVALPLFYGLAFVLTLVILFIWSLFIKKEDRAKPNKFFYFIVREVCHQLVVLSNTKVEITGTEYIPSGNFLLVHNHLKHFVIFLY